MANAFIHGRVVSYDDVTGSLVVTPLEYTGDAGSYNTWNVELAGKNGTSGASASSGTSGTSGSSASSGTHGTSATSGSSGTSGSAGTSASSGSSGTSGTSGSSGTSAVQGGTGPQGAVGAQGPTGVGGSSGTSGSAGATGPTGAPGPTGPTGPQGPQGPKGPTGATGPQGPTGTSASYNQNLNVGGDVTFTYPTSTTTWQTAYRFYMPGDAYKGIAGTYGPVWFGFNFGWASNAGLGGAFFFNSSTRSMKKEIEPFTKDATEIIKSTEIVTWDFESGEHTQIEHIGFIAEDTPEELATPDHNVMDTTNTLAVVLKAIQEIDNRVTALQNKNNNA
jgi:hypothetical protein